MASKYDETGAESEEEAGAWKGLAGLMRKLKPRHASRLSHSGERNTKIFGNPCYQICKDLDYLIFFNNQHPLEDEAAQMMLMLPMVSRKELHRISLDHERLHVHGAHGADHASPGAGEREGIELK